MAHSTSVIGQACAKLTHFFGSDDRLNLCEVLLNCAADEEIIKVTRLGNFVFCDAQAFLNDSGGILVPLFQSLLKGLKIGRSQKNSDQSTFNFVIVCGAGFDGGGALD